MKVNCVHLVSFSPCGHTLLYGRQMAAACAEAAVLDDFREWNVTPASMAGEARAFSGIDLVLLCAPVYGGRIPIPAVLHFSNLRGQDTPVILIVSYGNRAYDDALLEFTALAKSCGFWPVGAAACVAQHTIAVECASGRPDEADLKSARDFAARITGNVIEGDIDRASALPVPGNLPYRDFKPFALPQKVNDNCILCGQCWANCPTAAIKSDEPGNISTELCIACMGCINICPVGARIPAEEFLRGTSERLAPLCAVRKANEYFSLCVNPQSSHPPADSAADG